MERRTSRALHLGTKTGAGLRPTPCARSSARVVVCVVCSCVLCVLCVCCVLCCCCCCVVVVCCSVLLCVVVCCCCVCPHHHSHELAGPQLRRGGRKKGVKIRQKIHAIVTGVSHVKLEKNVQHSTCQQRKAKQHPEASTGHSSPFNRMEKKRCQHSSLSATKKMCEILPLPKY